MAHKIKVFFLLLGFLGPFNFWTISKLAALIFFNSEGNLIQGFRISRNFPLFPPCLHSSCYCSLLSYALLISKNYYQYKAKTEREGKVGLESWSHNNIYCTSLRTWVQNPVYLVCNALWTHSLDYLIVYPPTAHFFSPACPLLLSCLIFLWVQVAIDIMYIWLHCPKP